MEIVIWSIIGLVVGGIIGALATWWISRARGGAVSVMQLKQENDKFKNEVTEHFVETARLINQMTDSYKQVFDHLSSGAEKLVDEKSLAERLPPASGEEVKLSQFGASGSTGNAGNQSGTAGNDADRSSAKAGDSKVATRAGSGSTERSDPLKNKPAGEGSAAGQKTSDKTEGSSGKDIEGRSGDDAGNKRGEEAGDESDRSKRADPSASDQATDGSRARD